MKHVLFFLVLLSSSFVFSQSEEFIPIESLEDFEGIWITVDSSDIRLLEDEFAPMGKWFMVYDETSYFSTYLDPEWGATMDVEFTYELNGNTLNCLLIGSNSMGYLMEHENESFNFSLFHAIVEGERRLMLRNEFGTDYYLKLAE